MTRVGQKKSFGEMLRSLTKQGSTTSDEVASPSSSAEAVEGTSTRPRKKLSFKEPEFLGRIRMNKSKRQLTRNQSFSFDENPFEEENSDLEELEVQLIGSEKLHSK